jgi:hypothetical protein
MMIRNATSSLILIVIFSLISNGQINTTPIDSCVCYAFENDVKGVLLVDKKLFAGLENKEDSLLVIEMARIFSAPKENIASLENIQGLEIKMDSTQSCQYCSSTISEFRAYSSIDKEDFFNKGRGYQLVLLENGHYLMTFQDRGKLVWYSFGNYVGSEELIRLTSFEEEKIQESIGEKFKLEKKPKNFYTFRNKEMQISTDKIFFQEGLLLFPNY